jgi:hypothetical protein
MQLKRRIDSLATAALFVATCATTVHACDTGGNGATTCSVYNSYGNGCSVTCGSEGYACCLYIDPNKRDRVEPLCGCVPFGE